MEDPPPKGNTLIIQDVWSIFRSLKHSNMSEVDLLGNLVRAPPCCADVRSQHTLPDHEENLQVLPGPCRGGQTLMCWWHYHFLINTLRRRQKASCLTRSLRRLMETAAGAAQTWAVKPCWHISPLQVHPGWEYTLYYMQSHLPGRNTFEHMW